MRNYVMIASALVKMTPYVVVTVSNTYMTVWNFGITIASALWIKCVCADLSLLTVAAINYKTIVETGGLVLQIKASYRSCCHHVTRLGVQYPARAVVTAQCNRDTVQRENETGHRRTKL